MLYMLYNKDKTKNAQIIISDKTNWELSLCGSTGSMCVSAHPLQRLP